MASFYTFWVKSDKLAAATVPGFATLLSHSVVDKKKIKANSSSGNEMAMASICSQ